MELSINTDNQTVISDLTDTNDNTTLSIDLEDKINEIKITLNAELNKLNADNLKDKCKELGISGISKNKKPELVQLLETEFFKLVPQLKEKKANDLKSICKQLGVKGLTGVKKDNIIYHILLFSLSNMKFRLDVLPCKKDDAPPDKEPTNLILQLEKQKQQIELALKKEAKKQEEEQQKIQEEQDRKLEEEEKKRKLEEEEKKRKLEEEEEKKRTLEEAQRIKDELKIKEEEEKKEVRRKKQSIPKNVKMIVWNHYIGEDIIKHKCLCCKKVTISNTNFEVGHVLSEKNGGSHEINNLRPICFSCNHSMGIENMVDFVVKYGLFIG